MSSGSRWRAAYYLTGVLVSGFGFGALCALQAIVPGDVVISIRAYAVLCAACALCSAVMLFVPAAPRRARAPN